MRKNSVIFTTLSLLLASLFVNSNVFAGDIEWSGLYRIEAYQINNSELRSGGNTASCHQGAKNFNMAQSDIHTQTISKMN